LALLLPNVITQFVMPSPLSNAYCQVHLLTFGRQFHFQVRFVPLNQNYIFRAIKVEEKNGYLVIFT